MPNIVFGGRIRSFQPESLPSEVEDCGSEVGTLPPPPPPTRTTRHREVPIMREEVMGLSYSQFYSLPPVVWNYLTSAYRDSLRELCVSFSKAYAAGIDGSLTTLLDKTIPDIVHKLGRECMQGVLYEERGFLGTRIRCHQCSEEAEYHGDVGKSLTTGLGIVATSRSYYVCPGGHAFYPQDILLGVDGEHRILPSVQENHCARGITESVR